MVFLSEAFTRPRPMHRLAKLGFTQSYTYFTWRNTKEELTEYFTELAHSRSREYFRPNVWPNTPDILHAYLQTGGRPAFVARLVLAATLAANYGIYGPAFELMEHVPREPGSEEYLNSEKYEIRDWDRDRARQPAADHRARQRDSPRQPGAARATGRLALPRHRQSRDHLLFEDRRASWTTSCWWSSTSIRSIASPACVELDLDALGIGASEAFDVHDLLTDARYAWRGPRNYVELRPQEMPAHVFRVTPRPPHDATVVAASTGAARAP